MRQTQKITLQVEDRLRLQWIVERKLVAAKVIERAEIILLAEKGLENIEIAKTLDITRQKVARWRKRFIEYGIKGIEKDASRPGGKPVLAAETVNKVIDITLHIKPTAGDVWTQAMVAKRCGISSSSVGRIWKKYGIRPEIQPVINSEMNVILDD